MIIEMSEWAAEGLYNQLKDHAYKVAKSITKRHKDYVNGTAIHDIDSENLKEDMEHLEADQSAMAAIEYAMEKEKQKKAEEKAKKAV